MRSAASNIGSSSAARRAALAFLLALCGSLVLVACSSDPTEEASPPPPEASSPAEAEAEPPAPESGGQETGTDAPASSPPVEVTTPGDGLVASCGRPYESASPWNTPIGASPIYHAESERFVAGIGDRLTSDPTQFTFPVYEVTAETVWRDVRITGWFSNVTGNGRTMQNDTEFTVQFPIPDDAQPAAGDDSQIILVNPVTGDEWGAWQFQRLSDGTFTAENAYHYNTQWDAVPPPSTGGGVFVNRGAGLPYLAGLVRPCEIEAGEIQHALAFAYDSPSEDYVYPATKSDGGSAIGEALPEGARLQLDPSLTPEDLDGLGCTGPCLTVAKALQEYGMIVVDNSGRSKIMFEYVGTAGWDGLVNENTASPIPLDRFSVVDTRTIPPNAGCTLTGTDGNDVLEGTRSADVICGLGGDDEIQGLDGNDVIYGGEGQDTILGGAGQDLLAGGPGGDNVSGDEGHDVIEGGAGEDELFGGRGADRLLADDGEADIVDGGPGEDEATLDSSDISSGLE